MAEITKTQLENAAVDVSSIESIVNGAASPGTHTTRLGQVVKTLAKIIADVESSALSDKFLFDTTVTMADPGTGDLRFNNATIASVTALAFSALSAMTGNPNVRNLINSWDDTTTNPRATIMIRKANSPSTFAVFNINNAITDNTSWLQIPVTYVAGNGTFSAADELYISVSRAGLAGAGDMTGPGVSNDNRLVRMDGTTGKVIQQSSVSLDDVGNFSGVGEIAFTNTNARIAPTSTGFDLISSNNTVVGQIRNNAFNLNGASLNVNSANVVVNNGTVGGDSQFTSGHASSGGNLLLDWFPAVSPTNAWIKILYGRTINSAAAIREMTMLGLWAQSSLSGSETGNMQLFTRQAGVWDARFIVGNGLIAYGRTDTGNGTVNANELYVNNQKVLTPVQIITQDFSNLINGTTLIPNDNTIPQNTEGTEYGSLAITPKFSNSLLEIDIQFNFSNSLAANVVAALFWDSNANAIGTFCTTGRESGAVCYVNFKFTVSAGSTVARTYKLRAGLDRAGTLASNPFGFGGTIISKITIKEYRQ